MTFRPAADPIKSMERIYDRMNWAEGQIAELEANGDPYRILAYYRNNLRGLKSAKTRLIRNCFS